MPVLPKAFQCVVYHVYVMYDVYGNKEYYYYYYLSFLKTIVHMSFSIEPTNFILGITIGLKQSKVHLMIKV